MMTIDEARRYIEQEIKDRATRLDFSGNGLRALPPIIGQLTFLQELDLSGNQLTELPPEIGQLTSLKVLILSKNQLTVLPSEITELTSLQGLDLGGNQLVSLPSEIRGLTSLQGLFLSGNQLTALPPEIGQLTSLQGLDLSSNQLTELPSEITELTSLQTLDLRYNELAIPPEIIAEPKKPSLVFDFLKQQQTGQTRRLNEAKVLVVGQGSVGKTSLIRRLLYDDFDPAENKTEGIDIQEWQVKVEDQSIHLHMWDFGGQEIMHATHQFFLTKRSLYLLVLDARLGEEENRLEYWLKMVESFGGDSPVIIVGNKVDQQRLDLDQKGLRTKYPAIQDFVETSCDTSEGIDDLRTVITREVGALDHIYDELPLTWYTIKSRLEEMDEDYLPYHRYEEICAEEGVMEAQRQRNLVGFLHDLGVVLNFKDDPRLEDTNILNPEWVTNGVYKILNAHVLFQAHGELERPMLNQILPAVAYPPAKHLFIIDMMRKFELCYDFEGARDERFLVPDLLPKEEPYTGEWDDSLAFQYHYEILPGSIISRFIVRASQMIHQNTSWRTGVVLANEANRALIKADREDRKIYISVKGPQAGRRRLLERIRTHFEEIHATIPRLTVEPKVPVPGHPDAVVDYEHLLNLEELGETHFIPEGMRERVSVQELLDGVESRQDRQKRRAREEEFDVVRKRGRLKPVSAEPVESPSPVPMVETSAYDTLKKKLDRRSEQEAKRRFIYAAMVVLAFWVFLAYLTSEIGWDTMEPWTYFLGIFSVFASYLYFAIRQKEVSPRAIYQQLVESRKQRNYAAFDLEQYKQVVER